MFQRQSQRAEHAPLPQPVSSAHAEPLAGDRQPGPPALAGADRVVDRHVSGSSRVFVDGNRQTGGE